MANDKWIPAQNSAFWLRLVKNDFSFDVEIHAEKKLDFSLATVKSASGEEVAVNFGGSGRATIAETRQMASVLQLAASIAANIESYKAEFPE